jgi:hypothetical protein
MTKPAEKPKSHLSRDGLCITVHIPVTFRQRAGRKQIISPSGSSPWSPAPHVETALLKAIVRANRWREMLESGEYGSAAELAKAEKVNASYLSRVLRLTLLAPARFNWDESLNPTMSATVAIDRSHLGKSSFATLIRSDRTY